MRVDLCQPLDRKAGEPLGSCEGKNRAVSLILPALASIAERGEFVVAPLGETTQQKTVAATDVQKGAGTVDLGGDERSGLLPGIEGGPVERRSR